MNDDETVTGEVEGEGEGVSQPTGWYDDLTRLPGPTFWDTVVAAESARSLRFRRAATVVLVEILDLEDVLARWGRGVAIRTVADVAHILRDGCRASDYVMRLGGARFGMLLTETDEIAAINVVERLRARCERALATRSESARVAFGWASPVATHTLVEVIEEAERRLGEELRAGPP